MAPEKTLLTIWIELFGICLVGSMLLYFLVPGWSLIHAGLSALAIPIVIVAALHLYRSLDNRRMERRKD